VDEWGIWTDPEPGTNPGFLFQQNSLRDAFVAAISLNIFNRHCDRVKMANLAQTVNVLQALVFTNETQMVLTPTYWVFDMYKVHQDATLLPLEVQCGDYVMGKEKIKALHTSASKDASGAIHISIANVDPKNSVDISCMLRGVKAAKVTGQIITGKEITTCNTFEQPDNITLKDFNGASMSGETLSAVIPAKSIVTLEIK
jgi:alpha-N-arabinofuranosidase